ncbi:MAG: hypothetical protein FWD96_04770, partial [Defluviitaleaceae bacterium]|nr:hypothetical protein [Defluviitaleaceae bacterium]
TESNQGFGKVVINGGFTPFCPSNVTQGYAAFVAPSLAAKISANARPFSVHSAIPMQIYSDLLFVLSLKYQGSH